MIQKVDFDCPMNLGNNRLNSDTQDQVNDLKRSVKYISLDSQLQNLPNRELNLLILLLILYGDL